MMRFDDFMKNDVAMAKGGGDMIGKIIGIVFGVYVVAYALVTAILAMVNQSVSFNTSTTQGAALQPVTQTLIPIIVVIGIGWMFYKQMTFK